MGTAKAADGGSGTMGARWVPALIALTALLLLPATGAAQSDGEEQNIEQLAQGQQLYSDNCAGCHQPGGLGIAGSFPPLKGNPRVDDAEYVRGVIQNGRSGQIEVDGEIYDGVMPPVTGLDDGQIDALIAYLQNDLTVPGGDTAEPEASGPTAGTTIPGVASSMSLLAYLIAIGIAAWILAPRVIGVIRRGEVSPLDAGLKSGLIVVYFIATTVLLPSYLLSTEVISRLAQGVQDFVATAVWGGGLAIGLLGLWWFQRQDRI